MMKTTIALATAALLALPAAAQGIGHTLFMRGSVVNMTNGVATLCVGRADGAAPGQVRIDAVVDEHFARASVAEGKAGKHDIVELRRP